ncbi:hypothetical protein [Vallicoccus soli]|uniref:hypothetical protein n=1 Tax=Vallicoccus soli TaxID=2339232 RepID=UPI00140358F9|nr:hypothetical protein [Vallicoccus soli]
MRTSPAGPTAVALPAAGVALVLALVALLAAAAGDLLLAFALAAVQGVLLTGWHRVCGAGGAAGGALVALAAALGADGLVAAVADGRLAPRATPAEPVLWVLGPAVLVAFLAQLARRDGRPDVVRSVTATLAAAVVAVLGALALGAVQVPEGAAALASGLLGAVVGLAVAAVPVPGGAPAGAGLAAVLGAGAGAALAVAPLDRLVVDGDAVGALGWGPAAGAGCAAVAALLAVAVLQLARTGGDRASSLAVAAAAPVLLAAPLAYAVGRALA